MADLRNRLGALSLEKRALLTRRLVERQPPPSEPQRLPRQSGLQTFQTSFAQERLWFLEQVAPGSAVYNVAGQFYATQDECTHTGGPLSQGQLDETIIVCPWHASCFDVTVNVFCASPTCPWKP